MSAMRFAFFVFVLPLLAVVGLAPGAPPTAAGQELDRESFEVWLCPLHRDEQDVGPGTCPVCERELVKRLLVPSYSCPMHQHIDEDAEGSCPVCNMNLVPTTRELQWFCAGQTEIVSAEPGQCPDGTAMKMRSIPMAHGDHNPKHGGILFMAPNGNNHLEGTLDEDGTFRLYLYNDFTKPIDATPFQARIDDMMLTPTVDGSYLSGTIDKPDAFPAELVVHIRFPSAHDEEARFDFIFPYASTDEAAAAEVLLPEFIIPETADGKFAAIRERDERLQELIANGVWQDLYIPALEAKDLGLALEEQEGESVAIATKKLVRAAWLLDTFGDMGNKLEVEKAYEMFVESIEDLEAARAR